MGLLLIATTSTTKLLLTEDSKSSSVKVISIFKSSIISVGVPVKVFPSNVNHEGRYCDDKVMSESSLSTSS